MSWEALSPKPKTQREQALLRLDRAKGWTILLGLILFLFADGNLARAGIYRYVDENGVIHFSNVPTNPQYLLYLSEDGDTEFVPPGKTEFDHLIEEAAERYSVDSSLIKAVIRAESDFDPWAVSQKGAMGLMQLMPETADDLSVMNAFDPGENIDGGVRYLRHLLDTFKNDLKLSLAAYNAGKNAVLQFKAVPPYDETQRYVKKVLRFYEAYDH